MREYRHKGCKSVMYTHIGDGPSPYARPRSAEWRLADGSRPGPGSTDVSKCSDCDAKFFPTSSKLEALDGGSFYAPLPWPAIPTQRTLWERIKAFFTED